MLTIARARAASPSRSPTAAAVGMVSARPCALFLISPGLPVCAFEPRLQQRHLGGEVVVAAAVVGQARRRLAGLPRADGPLALGGADVDGAVLVDPAPLAGVAAGAATPRPRGGSRGGRAGRGGGTGTAASCGTGPRAAGRLRDGAASGCARARASGPCGGASCDRRRGGAPPGSAGDRRRDRRREGRGPGASSAVGRASAGRGVGLGVRGDRRLGRAGSPATARPRSRAAGGGDGARRGAGASGRQPASPVGRRGVPGPVPRRAPRPLASTASSWAARCRSRRGHAGSWDACSVSGRGGLLRLVSGVLRARHARSLPRCIRDTRWRDPRAAAPRPRDRGPSAPPRRCWCPRSRPGRRGDGRAAGRALSRGAACSRRGRRWSSWSATAAPPGVRFGAGDAGDLRGFGVDLEVPFAGRVRPGGRRLPLAHTLGAWLLDRGGPHRAAAGRGPRRPGPTSGRAARRGRRARDGGRLGAAHREGARAPRPRRGRLRRRRRHRAGRRRRRRAGCAGPGGGRAPARRRGAGVAGGGCGAGRSPASSPGSGTTTPRSASATSSPSGGCRRGVTTAARRPWSPSSAPPPPARPPWRWRSRTGSAARWSTPTRCSSTAAWTSGRRSPT